MSADRDLDAFLFDQRRLDVIRALTRPGLSDDEVAFIEHRDVQMAVDEADVPAVVPARLQ